MTNESLEILERQIQRYQRLIVFSFMKFSNGKVRSPNKMIDVYLNAKSKAGYLYKHYKREYKRVKREILNQPLPF